MAHLVFYMTMPTVTLDVPGLPDINKPSAIALACWLGTILFASDRLLAFRPRWFDIPLFCYVLSPFPAAISNELTVYDGVSGVVVQFLQFSGSPYLLGRVHFRGIGDLRALAVAIFFGGLAYTLPCLYEIRMSPVLQIYLYGTGGGDTFRLGGYRPMVFLYNGLELGLWMAATCVAGYTLWLSGALKQVRGFSAGWALAFLIGVTILCRSSGALAIMMAGCLAIYLTRRLPRKAWILALVLVVPLFVATRPSGILPLEDLSQMLIENFDAERGRSFKFRVDNEDLYIAKSLQRPLFGWGGYNRHQVYNEEGLVTTINDSRWILSFSTTGLFGLVSWTAFMMLPGVLLALRIPARDWLRPAFAPATALAVVATMFALDNLVNCMDNPIYSLSIGAVASILGVPGLARRAGFAQPGSAGQGPDPGGLSAHLDGAITAGAGPSTTIEHRMRIGRLEEHLGESPDDPSRLLRLAFGHDAFARHLAEGGLIADAEEVWSRAIDLLDELAARLPDDPQARLDAAEARNDLAWMLVSRPNATLDEAARGIGWAEEALRISPDNPSFRNTLAMSLYRANSWAAALSVLESPDDEPRLAAHNALIRALAHQNLGDTRQARSWRDRAWKLLGNGPAPAEFRRLAEEADRRINRIEGETSRPRLALPSPGAIANLDQIDKGRANAPTRPDASNGDESGS
ncbi:MAG: hypothetical protein U0800_16975 [Isosphaeraceae bacterium]